MILEIEKQNEQYIISNLPLEYEKYFIKIEVENISSKKEFSSKDDFQNSYKTNKAKAILSLKEILKLQPDNEFILRKIKWLSQEKEYVNEMTDKEALYLALTDKYGL